MKKSIFKILAFLTILFVLFQAVSYFFIPNKSNLFKFGYYNKTKYDLLNEEDNTIDVIFLGDSLVYNGISPMYIWNEYGYTSYDCAVPAATSKEIYNYAKVIVESQKPKLVFVEGDVLFRKMNSTRAYKYKFLDLKKHFPLFIFHNNWKQLGKDEWINPYKGFKYSSKVKGPERKRNMKKTNKSSKIEPINAEYYEKMIKLFKDNGIEVIMIENPTITWNYKKHNSVEKFAHKNNVEIIDLNLEDLKIDWAKETKDKGVHMNYLGARKVTKYFAEYIKEKNVVEDHRNDSKYDSWHKAYEIYKNRLLN